MDLYDKLIVTAKFEKYVNRDGWLCAQYQVEVLNPDNDRPYNTVFRVGLRDEIVKDAGAGTVSGKRYDVHNEFRWLRAQVENSIKTGKPLPTRGSGKLKPTTYKPSKQDVLYAICSDAENTDQPFEDWAADLGYDTDSRKAEAIYNECVKTRHALTKLCGSAEALESLTQRTRDIDNGDDNCRQGDK